MKEASYASMLSNDIQRKIGGKVIKISDRSTLGLPDSSHLFSGIATYLEFKIGDGEEIIDGITYIQPWKTIKKDLRQFEVCKAVSKEALVLYCIYYPRIKATAVLTIPVLECFRKQPDGYYTDVQQGRGLSQLKKLMQTNREEIYDRLDRELGTGIS